MATETNLTKVNVFPSEQSYETNKSSLGTGELSLIKVSDSIFTGIEEFVINDSALATPSYIRFTSGLMIEWGRSPTYGTTTITYPYPFYQVPSTVITELSDHSRSFAVYNLYTTSFTAKIEKNESDGDTFNWVAIGSWN